MALLGSVGGGTFEQPPALKNNEASSYAGLLTMNDLYREQERLKLMKQIQLQKMMATQLQAKNSEMQQQAMQQWRQRQLQELSMLKA